MNVMIYTRGNNDYLTAQEQMKKLRSFCQARDYAIVEEVSDYCSGLGIGENLHQMLNEYRQTYDAVVIQDLSRISRNIIKLLEVIELARRRGIQLIVAGTMGAGKPAI